MTNRVPSGTQAAVLLLLASAAPRLAAVSQAPSPPAPCTAAFHIEGAMQRFPLRIINSFVFLAATVDETPGHLMFDTGTREALALNDHFLHLEPGKQVGTGLVGSGQRYTRTLHPCIHSVGLLGAPPVLHLANVESDDLGFIEDHITPDFLGFMGYESFTGYLFKLDYTLRFLTFYREDSAGNAVHQALDGETVLATLPFTTRKRPDDPFITVRIDGQAYPAAFDTGQDGTLEVTDAQRDLLIAHHVLLPLHQQDKDGAPLYRLDLELPGGQKASIPTLAITQPGSPADRGIGITEGHALFVGYYFLSQFKTVWDFDNSRIYLLQK